MNTTLVLEPAAGAPQRDAQPDVLSVLLDALPGHALVAGADGSLQLHPPSTGQPLVIIVAQRVEMVIPGRPEGVTALLGRLARAGWTPGGRPLPAPPPPPPPLKIGLPRPPWWSWWRMRLPIMLGAVCTLVLAGALAEGPAAEQAAPIATAGGVVAFLLAWLWVVVQSLRRPAVLEFLPGGVRLPRHVDDRNAPLVPWTELLVVDEPRSSSDAVVVSARRVHRYPRAWFPPGEWEHIVSALNEGVRAHSRGDVQQRGMAADAQRAFLFSRRPLAVTLITSAVLVAVHLWSTSESFLVMRLDHLVGAGANVPVLVRSGEWFRLFTASLLHANEPHLVGNVLCLLLLGRALERVLGHAWVLLLLAAGGLGSQLAVLGGSAFLVGASGAVFALLAGWVVVLVRHRDRLSASLRVDGLRMTALGVTALVLDASTGPPSSLPVSHLAHAGGALGGMLVLWPRGAPRLFEGRRLLAAVTCGAYVTVVALAFFEARITHPHSALADIQAWLRDVARENPDLPTAANNAAWAVAVDPAASLDQVTDALELALAAREMAPDSPALADTTATLHYRQGRVARALQLELPLLAAPGPGEFYASQAARWLMHQPGDRAWRQPRAELVAAPEGGSEGTEPATLVNVWTPVPMLRGFQVVAMAHDEDGTQWIFHACYAGPPRQETWLRVEGRRFVPPREGDAWRVVMLKERSAWWDCDPSVGMWRREPSAFRLP